MTTTTDAFEVLYQECRLGIERHIRAMMRNHLDEVEDIIQSTWYKVWRAWAQTPNPSYKWVERIATNTALDFLRAYKRHNEIRNWISLDSPIYDPRMDKPLDPQEAIQSSDVDLLDALIAREQVEEVLGQFRPHHRDILLLKYAGYSYGEIAERVINAHGQPMGIPGVKMVVMRAKEQSRVKREAV